MSQNLENLFKDSLQNLDAPYNPQAWVDLQSRLDIAMPVAAPKKPFKVWSASAIVLGIIGIFTAFYFLALSPITDKENSDTRVVPKKSTPDKPTNTTDNKEAIVNTINSSKTTNNTTQPLISPILKTSMSTVSSTKGTPSKKVENTNQNLIVGELPNTVILKNKLQEPSGVINSAPISIPSIANQCQNEKVKISNTNTRNLIVTFPSGKIEKIASNKETTLHLTEEGIYSISDNNFEKEQTFIVNSAKEPDFELDQTNIYKNGLPSSVVSTNFIAHEYRWTCDKTKAILAEKENEFHFFKEGRHTIELEVTDQNGCKNSTSKVVTISNDYNLMAVDAFNPLHNDLRRNTFMPFALKQRNTGFTLVIIDPKDGSIVYQTNDANAGWDGIDKRSGNLAISSSSYIWKVTLTNPLEGENKNYKGIILVTR